MDHYELVVSASDAEVLADLLMEARLVPHERLPWERIAMNSRVTYVLSPVGRALLGRRPAPSSASRRRTAMRCSCASCTRKKRNEETCSRVVASA